MNWPKDIFRKYDWHESGNPTFSLCDHFDAKKKQKNGGVLFFQPIILPKDIFPPSHWIKYSTILGEANFIFQRVPGYNHITSVSVGKLPEYDGEDKALRQFTKM